MKKIKIGTDFSGVGAAEYAIDRVAEEKRFEVENVFACDMDKYARISYLANHKAPSYFPDNVYNRGIPKDSLDIYVSSPPCQSFSLAGKRLGKEDSRGILFFNTHEFIVKNKPRYFIIENVKGLLSDDGGKTFSEWISMLGGKSVNGIATFFPHEEAAPYHIYWKVLNAKHYNVPQNRERVFIVGIREDADNTFSWPKEEHLTKRLKDVLEHEVDEKYFLSRKMVDSLVNCNPNFKNRFIPKDGEEVSDCVTARYAKMAPTDTFIKIVGNTNPSGNGMNGNVFHENGISPTLSTNKGEGIKVAFGVKRLDEILNSDQEIKQDSIIDCYNGSIHDEVSPSVTTKIAADSNTFLKVGTWRTHKDGTCPTIPARAREDGSGQPVIKCIPVLTPDRAEKRQNGRRFKEDGDEMFTITTQDKHGVYDGYRIRRLTPTECFRLMDFPDSHVENARKEKISDSQLYKQAGNSIVVRCLELIMQTLNF
jgi:DNA (cytosine-5)-methyltransferase 1